ncbi:MBL fold metallo-hydrolase [Clostridium sp.]|uniref:MBL fold metallo-hydrolase n=1 Tax=Clostridium sp. TaxID=1506 RepID=UPI00399323A9
MSKLNVEILKSSSINDGREMTVYPVLIFDEEKAVLIDTAYPGQFEVLKAEIEKHIDIEKLKGIVITHHDIDHVGTAKAFKEFLGDKVTIYADDVEADYISGEKTPLKIAKLDANKENLDEGTRGFLDFLKVGFAASFVKVDKTFKAGDRLPLFEEVETLDMPGHTLGHICVYVRDQKTLITGDAIALENGKLERVNDFYNHDIEQAKQSLEKLRDLDIDRVLCYHGGEYNGKVNVDELQK